MRVGRGDFAAHDWAKAVDAAGREAIEDISRGLGEEIDLHELLIKGLPELRALGGTA